MSISSFFPGLAASAAYLAEMALDMRLTGNRYDDLVLLGGFLSFHPRRQRLLGLAIHCGIGLSLARAYRWLAPALPRAPAPLQGLLFIQVENFLTFPGVVLGDAVHPAVRSGQLPRLSTWQYFWVETARHAAYGVVLGAVNAALEDRAERRKD